MCPLRKRFWRSTNSPESPIRQARATALWILGSPPCPFRKWCVSQSNGCRGIRSGSTVAPLVTPASQVAGDLPGNVSSHVVIPEYHLQGPMAGESPDVAEIAASVEGRCCRAVAQAMRADVAGQAGGLAQTANDPADRFPGKSDVRVKRAAVEAMEERAGFVAASLGPLNQGGGGRIGQGHAFFLGPAFPPNPGRGRSAIGAGLDVRSIEVA